MDDTIKYLKIAIFFPIVISVIITIMIIPILYNGNYAITYGNNNVYYSGKFIWPTPNYFIISSPFGRRNSPTKGASSYHKGIDIAASQGSKVLAIADGVVTFSGWNNSGGYMIIIEHTDYYDSRYCHLDENLLVKKGQKVYAGQCIATVGPKYVSDGRLNGATTGAHLHLGIRKNGEYINPLQFFSLK